MLNFISTGNILGLLTTYGYIVYFPLAIIEGPIVTIIAAFLASLGYFNLFLIYVLEILGNLIGDTIFYAIGRWGSKRILTRGRFLKIDVEQLKKLEKHFERHAARTLFLGKWTHYIVVPLLVAAGMSKMSFRKFIWFNFIGELPKSLVFLLIGYYFGRAYRQIDKYFGYASLIAICLIILIIVVYFLNKKFRKEINN